MGGDKRGRVVAIAVGAILSSFAGLVFAQSTSPSAQTSQAVTSSAPATPAPKELLHNADLSKGAGNQPDDWQTQAWINEPSAVTFTWTHPENGGPGMAEVNAVKADDARWMQSMALAPGWYYISADIRTEDVGKDNSGATISVMDDGIMSPEVKGTQSWTRSGLYMRVGPKGADVDVALRIGGFGSLNTGRAFFRNASVVAVDAPPPNAQPTYDLEKIRQAALPVPLGKLWSLVLTYLFLIGLAYLGWRVLVMEPPKVTRAEARREAKKKVARR